MKLVDRLLTKEEAPRLSEEPPTVVEVPLPFFLKISGSRRRVLRELLRVIDERSEAHKGARNLNNLLMLLEATAAAAEDFVLLSDEALTVNVALYTDYVGGSFGLSKQAVSLVGVGVDGAKISSVEELEDLEESQLVNK